MLGFLGRIYYWYLLIPKQLNHQPDARAAVQVGWWSHQLIIFFAPSLPQEFSMQYRYNLRDDEPSAAGQTGSAAATYAQRTETEPNGWFIRDNHENPSINGWFEDFEGSPILGTPKYWSENGRNTKFLGNSSCNSEPVDFGAHFAGNQREPGNTCSCRSFVCMYILCTCAYLYIYIYIVCV